MPTSNDPILECETREQLAEVLGVSVTTLTYFAYGSGKKYTSFDIPKKSGGTRTISAPVEGLVEIQRKLASHFVKLYPNLAYVHGFVSGRSILTNATPHLNKRQVLNIDLQDFFPTITTNRIIGLLRARPFNFNNKVASTIAGLTCYEGSLPQGAPTSPILSNMICLRMDKALRALCRRERITYSRYADDITFSTRKTFSASIATVSDTDGSITLGTELTKIITDNYFEINPKKTRINLHNQAKYVTGVKVNLSPNLPRKYVRQIRSMLHAWKKYGLGAAQEEFTNKYNGGNKDFVNVVRGKLAHLKNIKTDSDLAYGRLYNKFAELEGKGRPKIPITSIERLQPRVFVIESGGRQGTGFVLNGEWLLTCSHVVMEDPVPTHYFTHANYTRALQKITKPHEAWRSAVEEYDLIALPINTRDQDLLNKSFELPPADFEVAVGMSLRVVGFPAYEPGAPPHTMTVEVTALRLNGGHLNAYVAQKMVGGFSGSPVLNEDDQVVGVVQRGTDNFQTGDNSVGYTFLPIQELRECLKKFTEN